MIYTEEEEAPLPMPDNADPKPTIDERLDRLTARHEALTQTVELIAAMQRDDEKQFNRRYAEIAKAQKQDGEHIRALARIAEIHHERPLPPGRRAAVKTPRYAPASTLCSSPALR